MDGNLLSVIDRELLVSDADSLSKLCDRFLDARTRELTLRTRTLIALRLLRKQADFQLFEVDPNPRPGVAQESLRFRRALNSHLPKRRQLREQDMIACLVDRAGQVESLARLAVLAVAHLRKGVRAKMIEAWPHLAAHLPRAEEIELTYEAFAGISVTAPERADQSECSAADFLVAETFGRFEDYLSTGSLSASTDVSELDAANLLDSEERLARLAEVKRGLRTSLEPERPVINIVAAHGLTGGRAFATRLLTSFIQEQQATTRMTPAGQRTDPIRGTVRIGRYHILYIPLSRAVADVSGADEDELQPVTRRGVAARLCKAFGLPIPRQSSDEAELLPQLRTALSLHPTLIVFDALGESARPFDALLSTIKNTNWIEFIRSLVLPDPIALHRSGQDYPSRFVVISSRPADGLDYWCKTSKALADPAPTSSDVGALSPPSPRRTRKRDQDAFYLTLPEPDRKVAWRLVRPADKAADVEAADGETLPPDVDVFCALFGSPPRRRALGLRELFDLSEPVLRGLGGYDPNEYVLPDEIEMTIGWCAQEAVDRTKLGWELRATELLKPRKLTEVARDGKKSTRSETRRERDRRVLKEFLQRIPKSDALALQMVSLSLNGLRCATSLHRALKAYPHPVDGVEALMKILSTSIEQFALRYRPLLVVTRDEMLDSHDGANSRWFELGFVGVDSAGELGLDGSRSKDDRTLLDMRQVPIRELMIAVMLDDDEHLYDAVNSVIRFHQIHRILAQETLEQTSLTLRSSHSVQADTASTRRSIQLAFHQLMALEEPKRLAAESSATSPSDANSVFRHLMPLKGYIPLWNLTRRFVYQDLVERKDAWLGDGRFGREIRATLLLMLAAPQWGQRVFKEMYGLSHADRSIAQFGVDLEPDEAIPFSVFSASEFAVHAQAASPSAIFPLYRDLVRSLLEVGETRFAVQAETIYKQLLAGIGPQARAEFARYRGEFQLLRIDSLLKTERTLDRASAASVKVLRGFDLDFGGHGQKNAIEEVIVSIRNSLDIPDEWHALHYTSQLEAEAFRRFVKPGIPVHRKNGNLKQAIAAANRLGMAFTIKAEFARLVDQPRKKDPTGYLIAHICFWIADRWREECRGDPDSGDAPNSDGDASWWWTMVLLRLAKLSKTIDAPGIAHVGADTAMYYWRRARGVASVHILESHGRPIERVRNLLMLASCSRTLAELQQSPGPRFQDMLTTAFSYLQEAETALIEAGYPAEVAAIHLIERYRVQRRIALSQQSKPMSERDTLARQEMVRAANRDLRALQNRVRSPQSKRRKLVPGELVANRSGIWTELARNLPEVTIQSSVGKSGSRN